MFITINAFRKCVPYVSLANILSVFTGSLSLTEMNRLWNSGPFHFSPNINHKSKTIVIYFSFYFHLMCVYIRLVCRLFQSWFCATNQTIDFSTFKCGRVENQFISFFDELHFNQGKEIDLNWFLFHVKKKWKMRSELHTVSRFTTAIAQTSFSMKNKLFPDAFSLRLLIVIIVIIVIVRCQACF